MKRALLIVLTALLLLSGLFALPAARAESEQPEKSEALKTQIEETYALSQKNAGRSSFSGYCGAYVSHQLQALGITRQRVRFNGNKAYDAYKDLSVTTGGYLIEAYGRKSYTLEEALLAILDKEENPANILVGFEKSGTTLGKKYGHAVFIHGIIGDTVYFSECSAKTVEGVRCKEGTPITCPVAVFCLLYKKCTFDGAIHFVLLEEPAASEEEPIGAVSQQQAPLER